MHQNVGLSISHFNKANFLIKLMFLNLLCTLKAKVVPKVRYKLLI